MPMCRAALRHVLREVARRNRVTRGPALHAGDARRRAARPCLPGEAGAAGPGGDDEAHRRPIPADVDTLGGGLRSPMPDLRWARRDIKIGQPAAQRARPAGGAGAGRDRGDPVSTKRRAWSPRAPPPPSGSSTSTGVLRTRHLDHVDPARLHPRRADGRMLAEAGIPFEERAFTLEEMRRAREAFITSATSFVKPITAARWQRRSGMARSGRWCGGCSTCSPGM